jgi:GAF domain-containing protein
LLAELQGRLEAVLATRDRMRGLLEAVVAVSSGLDLESTLRRIVETAIELVDATYGALGVIGSGGRLAEFIPVGLTGDQIHQIDHWPEGRGLLGLLIKDPRPLRLASISEHAESSGFPAGHPAMQSFLGVPVRVRDEVFGNLYLTNKRGGGEFTEDDEAVLLALGAAAGVAVENARLYRAARRNQRWMQATAEVTRELLSGKDPGDVLARITSQARELSGADLAVLALPDDEGRRLTIAHADGDGTETVRGLVLPAAQSLSGQVLATGAPVTTADFADDERAATTARAAMGHVGPAVLFPLGAPGGRRGVLTIGRRHGREPFPEAEVSFAASFAAQAGVALELAASRAEAERLSVYQDRDRIARDLHDLVIQRLYATGMSLQGTMPMISRPEVAERVTRAVDAMDETIKEIRGAIFALQVRDTGSPPDPRADIVRLVEEMTAMLGFAPSLRFGAGLRRLNSKELTEQALIVLREALSNIARHAGASCADVNVDVNQDGTFSVIVTDDGTGIPEEGRRSGLRNLADRAAKLGGELRLDQAEPAAPRPGTRLEWRVPAGTVPAPGANGQWSLANQAKGTAGLAKLLPYRRVRDVLDDLPGLPGRVVTPDDCSSPLADDIAVLEGRHRSVEPRDHGGHVGLGVPGRQRDDRLAATGVEGTDHEVSLPAESGVHPPAHPGRVGLSEQVDLERAVHGGHQRPASDPGRVVHRLGPQHPHVRVAVHPGVEVCAAERERRGDRLPGVECARLGQAEHAVAEHL